MAKRVELGQWQWGSISITSFHNKNPRVNTVDATTLETPNPPPLEILYFNNLIKKTYLLCVTSSPSFQATSAAFSLSLSPPYKTTPSSHSPPHRFPLPSQRLPQNPKSRIFSISISIQIQSFHLQSIRRSHGRRSDKDPRSMVG